MESLTDSIRLRALGLGAGVIDILDCEVELLLMPLRVATIFAAAAGQHAQQLNVMAIEEGNDSIIQEVGRRDWGLAIVELGASNLGVSINEGLLIDAPHSLQVANIKRILRAAIAGMLTLELAMGLLLGLGFLQRGELGLGSAPGPLGRSWLPAP